MSCIAFNATSTELSPWLLSPISPSSIVPLGASPRCTARTAAGLAPLGRGGGCTDLGVATSGGDRWRQLVHLPDEMGGAPSTVELGERLQSELTALQLGAPCARRPAYTVGELTQIGFCATIEHALHELARAASVGSRLALALSIARKGRHAPLISLQWPWGGGPGPEPAGSAGGR